MKCEVCSEKSAVRICPRCHRAICDNCTDKRWYYCIDCASIKRMLQEDYVRYVDRLEEIVKFMKKQLRNSQCVSCIILRELALTYTKAIKELEYLAKKEGYEKLIERLEQAKNHLYKLTIELIVRSQLNYKVL